MRTSPPTSPARTPRPGRIRLEIVSRIIVGKLGIARSGPLRDAWRHCRHRGFPRGTLRRQQRLQFAEGVHALERGPESVANGSRPVRLGHRRGAHAHGNSQPCPTASNSRSSSSNDRADGIARPSQAKTVFFTAQPHEPQRTSALQGHADLVLADDSRDVSSRRPDLTELRRRHAKVERIKVNRRPGLAHVAPATSAGIAPDH